MEKQKAPEVRDWTSGDLCGHPAVHQAASATTEATEEWAMAKDDDCTSTVVGNSPQCCCSLGKKPNKYCHKLLTRC